MAICNCRGAGRNLFESNTPLSMAGTPGRIGGQTLPPVTESIDVTVFGIDRGMGLLSRINTRPYATLKLLPSRNDQTIDVQQTDAGLIFARLL